MRIFHYLDKYDRAKRTLMSITPGRSQDEVEEFFTSIKQSWEVSEQRSQLQSIISTKTLSHVNKIVAFACGGMAFYDKYPTIARSAYQHALIVTLREVLSQWQNPGHGIKCYAQDPGYTSIDKEVLKRSGVIVVDDPQGFLEVDDSTAVLSFGANVPVRQIIADISRPAMMIWDKIEFFEDELANSSG